jgi:hypothetical protein
MSRKSDLKVIVIVEEGKALPEYLLNIGKVIERSGKLDFQAATALVTKIDRHLKTIIKGVENRVLIEPDRLLKKGEPRAALISAFSILENRLYERLKKDRVIVGEEKLSLRKLYELAIRRNYDDLPSKSTVYAWINARNNLIHKGKDVPTKFAKTMVLEIVQYIRKEQ